MIPPNGEKRYHTKSSFFSFFGNLSPNNSGELTKKENLIQNTCGIKNTLEVVSLYSLVKTGRKANKSLKRTPGTSVRKIKVSAGAA